MSNQERIELTNKALELRQAGVSHQEIERELQYEFIFFEDMLTKQVVRATLWEGVNGR